MTTAARHDADESGSAGAGPRRAAPARAGPLPDRSGAGAPPVLDLDDPRAPDPHLTGGKAAALARLRAAGVTSLPGAVLTTAVCRRYDDGTPVERLPGVDDLLACAAPDGEPVVVRSSSVIEDQATTSAAGQFETVIGVEGTAELVDAVRVVFDSRRAAGAGDEPIAVLVQPLVEPEISGVYFGVDPVTARTDRRVVSAVTGRPGRLVSGEVSGSTCVLDAGGATLEVDVRDGVVVDDDVLTALCEVGDRLAEVFDGPQDVEWAVVDGELLVLQSRPVTTEIRGVPAGPVYGPGPIAETFPEALAPLETDLWVPPLRDGMCEALHLTGAAPARRLRDRDAVISVGGRVAVDLELTGELDPVPGWRRRLAPARRLRRLRSAWRIGRLRAALPVIADDLVDAVDADLAAVPALDDLTSRQLIGLIGRGRDALRSLHAHEILLGLVSDPSSSRFTGASIALRMLAELRLDGLDDRQIVERAPAVLALVPPRIGRTIELPADATAPHVGSAPPEGSDVQVQREALRLRVRWMQELTGQAAFELGARLARRGALDEAGDVRQLPLEQLSAAVTHRAVVSTPTVVIAGAHDAEPPLPARFRIGDTGRPIPVRHPGESSGGTGAGGSRTSGVVTHDATDPPEHSVLVVGSLIPGLASLLPRLAGVVAETGNVLSHLAILARESGVPVVVGHAGALDELPVGSYVELDGQTGAVNVVRVAGRDDTGEVAP